MNIFMIGIGGFIGTSLTERIIQSYPDWDIVGLDMNLDRLSALLQNPRLRVRKGTMKDNLAWIEEQIQAADVVLPLAAIADPRVYVDNPLKVFTLDFEENLRVIRLCVKHKCRLVFPSTSEVYGMSEDAAFDEETTSLVQGPIHKERWIYSTSKQLLDRLIYAYGKHEDLSYTIFRPFNWIGPHLDNVDAKQGGRGRALATFLGQIVRGKDIFISGDGTQRRCFTDIEDALDALMTILTSESVCAQQIFNIGHPGNECAIVTFAQTLLATAQAHPLAPAAARHVNIVCKEPTQVFGDGYQDIQRRVPSIDKAKQLLSWSPSVSLASSLQKTVDFHMKRLFGQEPADSKKAR
ncbi:bifunctional UDP-4-keto-pentose/UDP-xylose synthase [bacterium NHP-B]|nr:bifunctional UDP-4-keto-pentose/UDP-xylose synthase [bacterium NHP-B]